MNADMIKSLVRHLLTFGGGFMVSKGWLDAGSLETVIASVAALAGVAWGVFEKKPKADKVDAK